MNFQDLQDLFVKNNITLGSVESFTGGLFARSVTAVPGASKFFKGGFITYATEEKIRLLGVDSELIEKVGVVSQEVAMEMAVHAAALLDVNYCVSFTGNAGPSAMEEKPVGEIYIGVFGNGLCKVSKYLLSGTRDEIQNQAIYIALELINDQVNAELKRNSENLI